MLMLQHRRILYVTTFLRPSAMRPMRTWNSMISRPTSLARHLHHANLLMCLRVARPLSLLLQLQYKNHQRHPVHLHRRQHRVAHRRPLHRPPQVLSHSVLYSSACCVLNVLEGILITFGPKACVHHRCRRNQQGQAKEEIYVATSKARNSKCLLTSVCCCQIRYYTTSWLTLGDNYRVRKISLVTHCQEIKLCSKHAFCF